MSPWLIGFIGLIVGVIGTGLGGVVTGLFGRPGDKVLSFFLGFAGGIMLAIVFAELMPEAIAETNLLIAMIGFVLGVASLLVLDELMPHVHHGGGHDGDAKLTKMGYMLGLGIALHNFPEGLAIGAGFVFESSLGIGLAIVLALHNIPEGIAMAAPLAAGGVGIRRVILLTFLAGIPVGIGAWLGALLGGISPIALSLALAFAGGAMLYISFDELLPEAHNHAQGGHSGVYGGVFGVLVGYFLIHFF
ncbi:MAG: ZIP family metal transporter [Limnochordia bacterium]|jgi:ZIP family zinc transporter